MKQFTFSKLTKMGEHDEKYGTSYWGETNEQLEPVKFNSMNQDITADDTIEVEDVLLKTSAKGTDYHQLKKVKVSHGEPARAIITGNITPSESQHPEIMAKLDQILALLNNKEGTATGYAAAKAKADELREPAHTDADAPFDMNDIPF